ncbi:MAG TPA: AsmA family protein [Burkholderiales bacterium]|jgi:AsmA family protein|nr:AsmA family protein [Burkholderiales bacterium]
MKVVHRALLATLLIFGAIVAAVALLADSRALEDFVEKRIEARTGRDAHIGNIEIRIGRCLYVAAEDLRIQNPEWAKSPMLAEGTAIRACTAWLPLFIGRADLKEVRVENIRLGLEREGERATWKFDEEEDEGKSRVRPLHVSIIDSAVYFRDRDEKTEMNIKVSGGVGGGDEVRLEATGRFRDAPMQIVASTPAQMPTPNTPALLTASAVLGRTTAVAVGRFKELGIDGMDIQLALAGDDLAELNRLGINLPETPPFALRGRLVYTADTWDFSPFEGRIGDSDISGRFAYIVREPRPLLRADLKAHLLDFDDLGPLVGAPPKTKAGETASPEQKAKAQAIAANGRVLPDKPLGIDKWPRMDADVRFRADRVLRPNAVPVDGLNTHLTITDAKLQLKPLNFKMASGNVNADITIEGKSKPPRGSANIGIDKLELGQMFPQLDNQKAAAGKLYGRIKLDAHGESIAQLAGSANGEITLMVNGGHMSALLLELAGLDAGEAIMILASRGDKPVPLRCAIADFNVKDGQATSEIAVIDTMDTLFNVEGGVNLDEEALDLKVDPKPKDQSILSFRTPLLVGGHFNDPSVRPQAGPLVVRGGAVVLLALVNPILALAPLIETGPGENSDCGAFAQRARAEGVKSKPQKN